MLLRLFFFLILASLSASATTLVSITGTPAVFGVTDQQYGAASWSSPNAHTNVEVKALLSGNGISPISAFLTTQLGPGTTTAHQIAETTFTPNGTNVLATIFSGLSLGSGNYYLVLSGLASSGAGWAEAADPQSIILGPGVTTMSFTSDVLNPAYAPAGTFAPLLIAPWQFEVAGDPVPEPSPIALTAVPLLVLIWRARTGVKTCPDVTAYRVPAAGTRKGASPQAP